MYHMFSFSYLNHGFESKYIIWKVSVKLECFALLTILQVKDRISYMFLSEWFLKQNETREPFKIDSKFDRSWCYKSSIQVELQNKSFTFRKIKSNNEDQTNVISHFKMWNTKFIEMCG